ncbi:MAG: 3' terminal RNA ribose 2'-O-methyltransferase Hen1 [Streptosporangiales bacterium]|nr:3' terminal RNA ribose 2'-O-methyltransferase Hen1 [Streptosporangiales bacterium]
MLLTITSTAPPATDLGYLLHKHPDRSQTAQVSAGAAHVFYPQADEHRCTAALLLEVDPVRLVRSRAKTVRGSFSLGHYVNDRPYAASSLLAVAMSTVFRTAMRGRCDARPELAQSPLPLEVTIPVLPCRGGAALAVDLFGPLRWQVDATAIPLDETVPDWGDSPYVHLTLRGTVRLADALNQLYVLLPVLDDAKHYWVTTDEVDKLIRAGTGWLGSHPKHELIAHRYLAHQRHLTHDAVARLTEIDDAAAPVAEETATVTETTAGRALAQQRVDAVLGALAEEGGASVVDLGCGEGRLLGPLLADTSFTEVAGADVSARALAQAEKRLHVDRMSDHKRERLKLLRTALTYHDARLRGYDAAVLMEVIEHVDPARLPALADNVFGDARPTSVVVTTPNAEHNVRFPDLPAGAMRHPDHRFEWTREAFGQWAKDVAETYGYRVRFLPVGEDDPEVGPPTQLAAFRRNDSPVRGDA